MMTLEIQIQSIAFSIFFGLFISFSFNLIYLFFFNSKKILSILSICIYLYINFTLYFFLLKKINCGIVHNYFLLAVILGFVLGTIVYKKVRYVKFNM